MATRIGKLGTFHVLPETTAATRNVSWRKHHARKFWNDIIVATLLLSPSLPSSWGDTIVATRSGKLGTFHVLPETSAATRNVSWRKHHARKL